ncbi:MAG: FliH/SctL family protein [Roseburia sp.]|nr:FliH/SctL family protein [Roseburia sp.]
MSNLIKYPFVNMQGKEAVIINNNKEEAQFVPFQDKKIKIKTISEIEAEKVLQAGKVQEDAEDDEETAEFKAGLNVTNFDELLSEKQKEAEEEADHLKEQAREEAARIRDEAVVAAEAARNRGYEEGKEEGYQEGMELAKQEIAQREQELAEQERSQKEELTECILSIEEKYVDIVISLVKKLTGVVIEGKDDLILYLIQRAASELETSENYRIRVSSDDIYFLESHRAELSDSLGEDSFLEFVEEKGLEKGQCIIETDSQMADCGFETQLNTLIYDLKMLVR